MIIIISYFLKSITVPKIKLSKLLEIRAAIPYPGFVRTASNKRFQENSTHENSTHENSTQRKFHPRKIPPNNRLKGGVYLT